MTTPKAINVPPPLALLFYPAIGFVAEIALRIARLDLAYPTPAVAPSLLTLNASWLRVDVLRSIVLLRVLAYLVGGREVGGDFLERVMRISEKTFELTLCSQLSWIYAWHRPLATAHHYQPLWFGLTQKQEARAGFDAAMHLGKRRLLLLQYKAGKRLKNGFVRFSAPHRQMQALRTRVRAHRSVFYVLPDVTQTSELMNRASWLLQSTWALDVAAIPLLGAPSRKSQTHSMTLNPQTGVVTITSDPVEVSSIRATEFAVDSEEPLGRTYDNFEDLWSCAEILGRGAVAAALL